MLNHMALFAYFGPEVQLPLASLIGSIVGIALMVGTYPIRVVRERVRSWSSSARRKSRA